MEVENFKDIMSPAIKKGIEMLKAKEEWKEKIKNWKKEITESGIDTLVFSEIFTNGEKGYFYRDLTLSGEAIPQDQYMGTPVIIEGINCFIKNMINDSKNGEFYPTTYLYIEIIFHSTSNSFWILSNFPGEIQWRPYLFSTILDWPNDHDSGKRIGFALSSNMANSRFGAPGWTMIFDNDNVRKSIIQKFKKIESSLKGLISKGQTKPVLLFSK